METDWAPMPEPTTDTSNSEPSGTVIPTTKAEVLAALERMHEPDEILEAVYQSDVDLLAAIPALEGKLMAGWRVFIVNVL